MRLRCAGLLLWGIVGAVGCGGESATGDLPDASPPGGMATAQIPPTSSGAMAGWLADAHYLQWHCEAEVHEARPPGAHGRNRICSNDALAQTASGPFPAGAASVKEIHNAEGIRGFAVAVKLRASSDDGDGWYWYEKIGDSLIADGAGIGTCTGCHAGAGADFAASARDFVFTVVP